MPYISLDQAANEICSFGKRLYDRGYAAANDGNLSIRTGDDELLCTPTGVSKGCMTPDMLVHMRFDGTILNGGKPSSEVKMHIRVYEENEKAMAVAHLHPPYSSSFAAAGVPLDMPLLTEAIVSLGPVPVADFALPGSDEVPDSITKFCKTHNGALLSNHGPITWGPTLEAACFRMEVLEHLAEVTFNVKYIMRETGNIISRDNLERLKTLRDW